MTGKPVFAASEREKVLFPDPAIPVTTTRLPIREPASLIDVTVPHVLFQAHQLSRKQQPAPRVSLTRNVEAGPCQTGDQLNRGVCALETRRWSAIAQIALTMR